MASMTMGRHGSSASDGAGGVFFLRTRAAVFQPMTGRVTAALGGMVDAWGRVADSVRTRRAVRRLEELDDRMLRDIGLSRSEIPVAVLGRPQRQHRGKDQF